MTKNLSLNTLKIGRKRKLFAIAAILLLTVAGTFMACLPTAMALKEQTYAYLSFRPNPIGINQELLINAWVSPAPEYAGDIYHNYTFIFTRPNGITETYVFPDTEQTGAVWFTYYPDEIGTWTIQLTWPGQADREPCSTEKQPLVVQQDPIPPYPENPLPIDQWTYPINIEYRQWYTISGGWYMAKYDAGRSEWNPYTTAPHSSHIIWKLPPAVGVAGLIGGKYGTTGYYTKTSYSPSVIMAGKAYSSAGGKITCFDVRSGQTLWTVPGSFTVGAIRGTTTGQGTNAAGAPVSTTGMSGTPALYWFDTNRFIVYDGLTGAVTLNVTGMLSGATRAFWYDDPYCYSVTNFTVIPTGAIGKDIRLIKWDTRGNSANFADRIVWNMSWPCNTFYWAVPTINEGYFAYAERPVNWSNPTASTSMIYLVIFNATTGELVRNVTMTGQASGAQSMGSNYGIWYNFYDVPNTWAGYDLKTGAKLWDTSPPADYPWGNFWAYDTPAAYGMIYGLGYSGVYAWNVTDGKEVWHFRDRDALMETPYGTWPFGSGGAVIGGGIIFAPNSEHSPTLPYLRGWKLHALDAYTGNEIWNISGYWSVEAIAEGTLFATNFEDGYSYAFAKGQTATTISVQNDVYTKGSSVLIKGTVTDQSPAQPNTAAVSDDSMSGWMEYLHMQQPLPLDATGVQVKLTAITPNGEYVDIGTATTNTDGKYAFTWKPTIEGTYQIIATFEGSESYYASHATTYMGAGLGAPQPSTTTPAESSTASPTVVPPEDGGQSMDLYLVAAAVAIIAVVAVAAVYLRRRQK